MYLFDMDGTLIDSNDVWKDVDREFLARRGLPYTKAYYEGVLFGCTFRQRLEPVCIVGHP